MRCKSCRKTIDNENLYRCPHCGKPIVKKKKKDPKELMSIIPFIAVSALYLVINFAGFFFKCDYYNLAVLMIAFVLYLIELPFIFGNYKGMSRAVADGIAVAVSVPFIVNWFAATFAKISTLAVNPLSTVYYFSVLAVLIVNDVILILKASGIIGSGKIAKWICLSTGLAEAAFTFVFFAITKDVKLLAVLVMAVNSLLPAFTAYHVISRDSRD